jgi:hypothetical protein
MRCAICEEFLGKDWDDPVLMLQVEMGHIAEMYNPNSPEQELGVVHTECGISHGWEQA